MRLVAAADDAVAVRLRPHVVAPEHAAAGVLSLSDTTRYQTSSNSYRLQSIAHLGTEKKEQESLIIIRFLIDFLWGEFILCSFSSTEYRNV